MAAAISAPASPEGYFLIPKKLAIVLTVLAAYIAVALTVLAVGVWIGLGTDDHQGRELRTVAVQTRAALCGLREDLHQRVVGSQNFLQVHPNGLPKLGVSAASIEEGIHNQERTIATLSVLTCVHPKRPDAP